MVTALAVPSPKAALALLGHMQAKTGGLLSSFELISRPPGPGAQEYSGDTRDPLAASSPWYVLMEISGGAGAACSQEA